LGLVLRRGVVNRRRAALVAEPLVEDVETSSSRSRGPPRRSARRPALHVALVPVLEQRHDEGVLALEVVVESRLGDADFVQDPVEADGVEAMRVEEHRGRVHQPLASREGLAGRAGTD
jgi:hypothetical protein